MKISIKILLNNVVLLVIITGAAMAAKAGAIPHAVATLIGVAAAGALSWVFIRSIEAPIRRLSAALLDFSDGEANLTATLDESGNDELAEMAKYFNAFVGRLREVMSNMAEIAIQLADTADALTQGAEESDKPTMTGAITRLQPVRKIRRERVQDRLCRGRTSSAISAGGRHRGGAVGVHESLNVSSWETSNSHN